MCQAQWISVENVRNLVVASGPLAQLGRGEREAILLARAYGGRLAVLLDDRDA